MALVDHTAAQAAEPGRLQGCWTTGGLPGGHWAALDGSRCLRRGRTPHARRPGRQGRDRGHDRQPPRGRGVGCTGDPCR